MGVMREYDPNEVLIYFNGIRIDGFADGEFLTVEMMSDAFGEVVGTGGDVARSKSNDRRATAVCKLLQTSPTNGELSLVHRDDLNASNGAGVGTFQVTDLSGLSLVNGTQAWIVKYPDASYDRTAKSREWTIRIADCDRFEGGNLVP